MNPIILFIQIEARRWVFNCINVICDTCQLLNWKKTAMFYFGHNAILSKSLWIEIYVQSFLSSSNRSTPLNFLTNTKTSHSDNCLHHVFSLRIFQPNWSNFLIHSPPPPPVTRWKVDETVGIVFHNNLTLLVDISN